MCLQIFYASGEGCDDVASNIQFRKNTYWTQVSVALLRVMLKSHIADNFHDTLAELQSEPKESKGGQERDHQGRYNMTVSKGAGIPRLYAGDDIIEVKDQEPEN